MRVGDGQEAGPGALQDARQEVDGYGVVEVEGVQRIWGAAAGVLVSPAERRNIRY